ncbi:unnamed protein product [Acanthoscelides obtectus]|uniref:Uncharacterized protein n=1 Tax=Acanthoscelides obtectus TaxID=200917 RepID=A0A9P0PK02_ACAOB|nr:unnamed protein product [Acanthoscelides obtectus]CAK1654581.1 hypothetical protein AOBTE_LOCUS18690 [Acanthoscelides obtectus]
MDDIFAHHNLYSAFTAVDDILSSSVFFGNMSQTVIHVELINHWSVLFTYRFHSFKNVNELYNYSVNKVTEADVSVTSVGCLCAIYYQICCTKNYGISSKFFFNALPYRRNGAILNTPLTEKKKDFWN